MQTNARYRFRFTFPIPQEMEKWALSEKSETDR